MAKRLYMVRVHDEAYTGLKKISEREDISIADVVDNFIFGASFGTMGGHPLRNRRKRKR